MGQPIPPGAIEGLPARRGRPSLAIPLIQAPGSRVGVAGGGGEGAVAVAQAVQDVTPPETLKGRLLELLMCPFCKSYHVPIYLLLALLAGDYFGGIISSLVRVPVYGLAATRIGNLIDGLVPNRMRYSPNIFGDEHGRSNSRTA
jgi:hypothetical protein